MKMPKFVVEMRQGQCLLSFDTDKIFEEVFGRLVLRFASRRE